MPLTHARLTGSPRLSGASLVLSFVTLVPGALLYLTRPPTGSTATRLVVERGFIMGAVILTALGFLFLKEYLSGTSAHEWAGVGAYLYLFGAVLIVTAEALGLSGMRSTDALVVTYVVLAFLAQAAIGMSDLYVPVLHHFMPLVIGSALLVGGRRPNA